MMDQFYVAENRLGHLCLWCNGRLVAFLSGMRNAWADAPYEE